MQKTSGFVNFNHLGREYTAYVGFDAIESTYVVRSVEVHMRVKDRSGFKTNRSRYVYRGLDGTTPHQRNLIALAKYAAKNSVDE